MKQMQQQLAQVQAQLQNLPPQQRAALEQAMRGRGGLPGGFRSGCCQEIRREAIPASA